MTLPGPIVRTKAMKLLMGLATSVLFAACGGDDPLSLSGKDETLCSIPREQILSGQRKDGIPALSNPEMAFAGQPGTEYLREDDRVIGIVLDGQPIAVPLNIGWWHEVVNLEGPQTAVAISHCPLTGSSLAFDRAAVGGAEFGVSGLLFQTNLIMYDRTGATESLWPQMLRGARCGPSDGKQLTMLPIIEVTWGGWQRLHPDTKVITSNTGYDRNYQSYPYGNYDVTSNNDLLFPLLGNIDGRRDPKERVLGIPHGTGGVAFPFGELDELGAVGVVAGTTPTQDFVVLWEREREGAMAFRPQLDGAPVTLVVTDGKIMDVETGSEWRMDGRAISGPLEGRMLEPVSDTFVAFWFSWPAFYPDLELWSAS